MAALHVPAQGLAGGGGRGPSAVLPARRHGNPARRPQGRVRRASGSAPASWPPEQHSHLATTTSHCGVPCCAARHCMPGSATRPAGFLNHSMPKVESCFLSWLALLAGCWLPALTASTGPQPPGVHVAHWPATANPPACLLASQECAPVSGRQGVPGGPGDRPGDGHRRADQPGLQRLARRCSCNRRQPPLRCCSPQMVCSGTRARRIWQAWASGMRRLTAWPGRYMCACCMACNAQRTTLSCPGPFGLGPPVCCSPRAADGAALHPGRRHVQLWNPAGGTGHTEGGAEAWPVAPAARARGVPAGGRRRRGARRAECGFDRNALLAAC